MTCSNCGSESGDIEYSLMGRKFFLCDSCFHLTLLEDIDDNPLLNRIERDVG